MFKKIDVFFGSISSAILGLIGYLLGGFDILLEGLLILMALDILSGFFCAAIHKNLTSKKMFEGAIKKIGMLFIIAVSVVIGKTFSEEWIRNVTIGFFIGTEVISILENWGNAGLPLPPKIKEMFTQIIDKFNIDGGKDN